MLSRCSVLGCTTLTIGDVCLVHDRRPVRAFARGRPYVEPALAEVLSTSAAAHRTLLAAAATRRFD